MAKRVASFFGEELDVSTLEHKSQLEISKNLYPVIVDKFEGVGHWANRPIHNVLLSLTRRRPRDLVKLLAGAAAMAEDKESNHIRTQHLTDSFPEYSKGRITDLVSEFKSELPKVEDVLYSMKPTKKELTAKEKPYIYTNDELISKLNRIASNQSILFKNGKRATGPLLAEFLFKIDFVIARKDSAAGIERLYYHEHSKLQSTRADFGYGWEIHPAYRWALQPRDVAQIIEELDL